MREKETKLRVSGSAEGGGYADFQFGSDVARAFGRSRAMSFATK